MLSNKHKHPFWLLAALQLGILAIWSSPYVSALIFGTIVYLEAHVYDPKDPWRGQYIRLRYSHVPNEAFNLEDLTIGQPVFLPLRKDNGYWRAAGPISLAKPEGVFLRGLVVDRWWDVDASSGTVSRFRLSWGIEEFFVEEGTGLLYERAEELKVTVQIGPSGLALIRNVEVVK
jgi:uncharacterized membrane-anchored protein